jgi:hypothetical protein
MGLNSHVVEICGSRFGGSSPGSRWDDKFVEITEDRSSRPWYTDRTQGELSS